MLLALLVVCSFVGAAAVTLTSNQCPKDNAWTYILEYLDDETKDDIPDNGVDIAAGVNLENAFYIGSEALKRFDIRETQVCWQDSESCRLRCRGISITGPQLSDDGEYLNTKTSGAKECYDNFAGDQPTRHKRFLATLAGSGDSHSVESSSDYLARGDCHGYGFQSSPSHDWLCPGTWHWDHRRHWNTYFGQPQEVVLRAMED